MGYSDRRLARWVLVAALIVVATFDIYLATGVFLDRSPGPATQAHFRLALILGPFALLTRAIAIASILRVPWHLELLQGATIGAFGGEGLLAPLALYSFFASHLQGSGLSLELTAGAYRQLVALAVITIVLLDLRSSPR